MKAQNNDSINKSNVPAIMAMENQTSRWAAV